MDKKTNKISPVEEAEVKVEAKTEVKTKPSTKQKKETGKVVAVCANFLLVVKDDGSAVKVYGKEANDGDTIEI